MDGDTITVTYATLNRGFYLTPQLAKMQSQQTSLQTQYKENDHVRLAFVIVDDAIVELYEDKG